jgi:PIN domain nuclease of toxin-antitoxin system
VKGPFTVKILLDTCSFLWIVASRAKLSPLAIDLLEDRSNVVFLSTASAWEIAIKYSNGRLPLPDKPSFLVPKTRNNSNIQSLNVDEESALLAGRLAKFHTDPFDRMLVAQAIVHEMVILTPDPHIEQYAVRVLW